MASKYFRFFPILLITVTAVFQQTTKADIVRRDDGFEAEFSIINEGRLYSLHPLMVVEHVAGWKECAHYCIRHLQCKTFNHHSEQHLCELVDFEFDENEVDEEDEDWYNYATPRPVNGRFSSWTNGECSSSCGGGTRHGYRSCTQPKPRHGGLSCEGENTRTEVCNTQICPPGNCTWVQQGRDVCFGSFRNQHGPFTVTMDGMLSGVMLEYLRGGVTCNKNRRLTNWGCDISDISLGVLITKGRTFIFPPEYKTNPNLHWYRLPGVTNMDPKLTLFYPKSGIQIVKGTVLNVVYNEDLIRGGYDNPKTAKTCTNVYAKFNC